MPVLISHVHTKCYESFEQLLEALQHPARDFATQFSLTEASEEFDKYKIWAGNVGAAHTGRRYEISLDYRLREASFMKSQVVALLETLLKHLSAATSISLGKRLPFEEDTSEPCEDDLDTLEDQQDVNISSDEDVWEASSDLSSESDGSQSPDRAHDLILTNRITTKAEPIAPGPVKEMTRLLSSIKFTLACLYRIPIRKPAPLDRLQHQTTHVSSYYQHFDALYVRDKFPQLNESAALRLGGMITRRRQILKYREEHNERLATARTQSVLYPSLLQPSSKTGYTFPDPIGNQNVQATSTTLALSQATSSQFTLRSKATTFQPGLLPQDLEHDVHPTALYAPSAVESKTSIASSYANNDLRVAVPPRPKDAEGREREMFECHYCLITTRVTSTRSWKKHIFDDLQPYVCTFGDCELFDHFFKSKEEWFQHESQQHRAKWFCNTEHHPLYDTESEFLTHMKDMHRNEFVASAFERMKSVFRYSVSSMKGICNLCMRESTNLKNHVSRHLQQMALFALPRVNEIAGSGYVEQDTLPSESRNVIHRGTGESLPSDDNDSSQSTNKKSPGHLSTTSHDSWEGGIDDAFETVDVPDSGEQHWDKVTNKFSQARALPPEPVSMAETHHDAHQQVALDEKKNETRWWKSSETWNRLLLEKQLHLLDTLIQQQEEEEARDTLENVRQHLIDGDVSYPHWCDFEKMMRDLFHDITKPTHWSDYVNKLNIEKKSLPGFPRFRHGDFLLRADSRGWPYRDGVVQYPLLLNKSVEWSYRVLFNDVGKPRYRGDRAWLTESELQEANRGLFPTYNRINRTLPWKSPPSGHMPFIDGHALETSAPAIVDVTVEDNLGLAAISRLRLQIDVLKFLISNLAATLHYECPECLGKGLSTCNACSHGKGNCPVCRGRGLAACNVCGGAGELREEGRLASEVTPFLLRLSKIVEHLETSRFPYLKWSKYERAIRDQIKALEQEQMRRDVKWLEAGDFESVIIGTIRVLSWLHQDLPKFQIGDEVNLRGVNYGSENFSNTSPARVRHRRVYDELAIWPNEFGWWYEIGWYTRDTLQTWWIIGTSLQPAPVSKHGRNGEKDSVAMPDQESFTYRKSRFKPYICQQSEACRRAFYSLTDLMEHEREKGARCTSDMKGTAIPQIVRQL